MPNIPQIYEQGGGVVVGGRSTNTAPKTLQVKASADKTKTINNVALTSNVATITTSTAHGFFINEIVVISGLTNTVLNGTFTITGVPSTTTFTVDKTNTDITSTSDSGTAFITQISNLQEWLDSSGASIITFSPTGGVTAGGVVRSTGNAGVQAAGVGTELTWDGSSGYVQVYNRSSSTYQPLTLLCTTLKFWTGGGFSSTDINTAGQLGINKASSMGGMIHVVTLADSYKGIVVTASASQSVNLQEWQNSSGTALSAIGPNGNLVFGTTPATTGVIRLQQAGGVFARNNANSADVRVIESGTFQGSTLADGISIGGSNAAKVSIDSTTEIAFTSTTITHAGITALTDGSNITSGTTTGTKIGTSTSQKFAFWNATPIVQPANTVEIVTGLVNLGLRASGGNPDLTLGTGVITSGRIDSTVSANHHVVTSTTTPTASDYYMSLGYAGNVGKIYVVQQGVGGVALSLGGGSNVFVGSDTDDSSGAILQVNGGINVKYRIGPVQSNTDGATVTFDLNASDYHTVTLGGNRTLALSNAAVGKNFTLRLQQDATGGRTVTWFSGINWFTSDGNPPTLASGANKATVVTFMTVSSGVHDGFVVGVQA